MHYTRVPSLPDRHVLLAIAAVALGRALDYLATWVTQQPATVGEGNPVMATAFATLGKVPALALAYLVTLTILIAGVETAARLATYVDDRRYPTAVRAVGYGIPTAASLGIVVWNLSFLL